MRHGSLFSGIGGFDLAAQWMGWENVFHCEWNPFGQKVLSHYWPDADSISDIKQKDFSEYANRIDVLSGGFPCQGFSLAGNRLGTDDDRYLWPEMLRVIRETKPTFVVGENVTGILSMEDKSGVWAEVFARVEGRKVVRYDTVDHYEAVYTRQVKMLVSTICEDLEKEGFEVQPFAIPACSVGAPHKRERIWFVGYSKHNGLNAAQIRRNDQKSSFSSGSNQVWESQGADSVQSGFVADTDSNVHKRELEFRGHREPNARSESENKQQIRRDENRERFWTESISGRKASPNCANSGIESLQLGRENRIYEPELTSNANQFNGDLSGLRASEVSQLETTEILRNRGSENDEHANSERFKECNTPSKSKSKAFGSWRYPTNWTNWPTQPPVCDGDDGFSSRLVGLTFSGWRNESIKGGATQ